MAEELEKRELNRIEDFISIAKEGKEVQLSVSLRKQTVTQKLRPEEKNVLKNEADIYLLIADFSFTAGTLTGKISKIYVSGTVDEPLNATRQQTSIANSRLKMDYLRLRSVNIIFEEVFF